ncbi:5-oxoprolinase subunit PxpB [Burkholderia sp. R-69608]|nr:5-oxoprolinase subunit PxpB [Paraburkholderia nemoris]KPD15758.1 hypothetical protein ADM96_30590 [Burkholderia sp. ST111]MBK5153486.1 5-oxoprolinase subunit PxpB [Burkholderia sp. R-69608]MBK5185573.1 5-oxoprolinase subunit PxpB [Burkholderia sp. R-69749]
MSATIAPSAASSAQAGAPRIHAAGAGAVLFDPAAGTFSSEIQQRLQAVALRIAQSVQNNTATDLVLGVNNLLFVFDPLECHPDEAANLLTALWETTDAISEAVRELEVPVIYGGAAGEDLPILAASLSIDIEEYVRRHSEAIYSVACIGSMPGFAYMTGLPEELAVPRRKVPRMKVGEGTVIIGGAQAGVMPCTAPSGWHLLGRTDVKMFDPYRDRPCSFSPGDQVKFVVKGIEL